MEFSSSSTPHNNVYPQQNSASASSTPANKVKPRIMTVSAGSSPRKKMSNSASTTPRKKQNVFENIQSISKNQTPIGIKQIEIEISNSPVSRAVTRAGSRSQLFAGLKVVKCPYTGVKITVQPEKRSSQLKKSKSTRNSKLNNPKKIV